MSEIIAEPALFGTKLTESDTFELNFNPSPTNKQTNKQNKSRLTVHSTGSRGEFKLVHWPLMGGLVTFGTARRGLGGTAARPAPPRCTKCNSPPINGQCTNHPIELGDWYGQLLYNGPLLSSFDVPIKGLMT